MKGQTYIIVTVVFALIIAIFAVINVEPVEVNYLFGTGRAPLILIILISVLMGVVVTATVGLFRLRRANKEIKRLRSELSGENLDPSTEFTATNSLDSGEKDRQ
ncbi:lipopolysaccharide assembly protein LapA domain-containing protein [Gracilibacillus sp. JCM 18860]|uniref:lipopolysaccharide assembly protein LapA domain-containing protein n=1 Tax=Gracilibacillus TaxID=74385 RepID=UPI0006D10C6C